VLAHAAFLCLYRYGWSVLLRFVVASVLAVAAVMPFLLRVVGQAHQIIWIAPIGRRTFEDVFVQQYFERSPPFTLAAAIVVVLAVVLWRFTDVRLADGDRRLLTVAIAWLVIPTAFILGWSALVHPIYTPRYLCFTAPAMALLLGVCVGALAARPWATTAAVGVLAIAAAPNYLLVQRGPYAKYGMDYSQVADLIAANAAPGDCLMVNDTVTFMPAPMRPLLAARPDAYRKLADISLWQKAIDRDDVFDTNLIPEASAGPLDACRVAWIITQADPSRPQHEQDPMLAPGPLFGGTAAFTVPRDHGYRLLERWQFNLVQVIRAVR
jgi:mannosyltransferase